jgi:hypothetical protein
MSDIGRVGWIKSATADNAAATATKAAVSNKQHIIYGIDASFSAGSLVKLVTLKDGSTVIWSGYTQGSTLSVEFPHGIAITAGTDAVAVLAASGTGGTIGYVNLHGVTR